MAIKTSNLNVRFAVSADQLSWDNYVLGHPDGTAFQLFAWGMAVKQAYALQRIYLLAEYEGKVCGVIPLIAMGIPMIGHELISLPYCDAGGILADSQEVAQALWNKALAIAEERHCVCRIRSNCPIPFAGEYQSDKVRMVLDLPENSDLLLASLKSKLRSQIKKPLRDGLVAKIGAEELTRDFYAVFAENMRDLGSPVHSKKWIDSVVAEYKERARVAVVYAADGIPAAAGIILLHSITAVIPWASSLRRYNGLSPNMLLYWTLLAFSADSGFKRFDFGRSTPGEGTWRFKEQWGAVPQPLYWYANKEGKSVSSHKNTGGSSRNRQMAAALWSKLPVSGANWLGSRIRKYISL